MRHTLIPPQERVIVHREYHTRATVVLFAGLSLAVVIGIISMLPGFISAWAADIAAGARVISARSKNDSDNLSRVEVELSADKKILAVLVAGNAGSRASDAVRIITDVRSNVSIFSFKLERSGTSTVTATIQGVAPTRASLLSFKSRLESLSSGARVDLPIEALKESTNVQFSLRTIQNLP